MAVDMDKLRAEIEKRGRWSQILSLIEPPESFEIDAAIFDALDDINSWEPNTRYTLEWVVDNSDTRWLRALYEGAAYRIVDLLVKDWTANGIDVDLGDGVALSSKLSDYSSLRDSLKSSFEEGIERLKTTVLKTSRVKTFSTRQGLSGSPSNAFGRRSLKSYKSSKI